jgi:hypothetical protein
MFLECLAHTEFSVVLTQAPPGLAGWRLPAQPMLNPAARPRIWAPALAILRARAT